VFVSDGGPGIHHPKIESISGHPAPTIDSTLRIDPLCVSTACAGAEHGAQYLIKVPGFMSSGLDDRDVATVANWMLVQIAAGSVAGAYPPYSAAEVARVRALPLPDVTAERRRLFDSARGLGIETY